MYGYLIINGLLFLIIGARALLKPIEAVALPYGLDAGGVDARSYLRSAAGGVTIACGAVQLAAVMYPKLELPALVLVVTVLAGLVLGRAFSVCVDGLPGAVVWIAGSLELIGLGFGLFWLLDLLA